MILVWRPVGPIPGDGLRGGAKSKIKLFQNMVMLQQHGRNILPTDTPLTMGWVQKVKPFFFKVVMLHIKLKGIEYRAPWKQIFCPYTHPRPLGWGQRSFFFFSESYNIAFKIKGKEVQTNMQAETLILHTPLTSGIGFERSDIQLCR